MVSRDFFEEAREQSIIKSEIVSKYFDAWATVINSVIMRGRTSCPIAYVDLFCGPGRYNDGTKSTPIKILEMAIAKPEIAQNLICHFNDKDHEITESLAESIASIPGINTLKYEPKIHNNSVGTDILDIVREEKNIPTFFFIDPWGYKGLSLQLINQAIGDWGSDCVFFFNYNRINMGITNDFIYEHMEALFGKEGLPHLKERILDNQYLSRQEREIYIIEEVCQSLKRMGTLYVLPFRFKSNDGKRTSHYLIFVTKNFLGYDIMKDIMSKESSSNNQGVPSFEYIPPSGMSNQTLLFKLTQSVDDLKDLLLERYAGDDKYRRMRQIYEEHSIDTPFTSKNYKDALSMLLEEGKITTDRKPRKGTFADNILVKFC